MKINFFGKPKSIIFVLLTIIAVNFFVFNQTAFAGKFDDEFQIFQLVNSERYKNHLENLEWDDKLAEMARDYSQKMARENFFEHADLNGKTIVDRAKDWHVKNWSKIGENLFFSGGVKNFDTLCVRSWMKSPTHRQNILDRSWTATGIGIAESKDGKIFITQVFIER
ncbi:hypothetical protein BH20ACI1_BH20ACI1_27870 [soil metagenome]